jgi:hypothetical protein
MSYEETRAFQEHLAQCTECSKEYAAFERTVGLLRALPEVPAPASFVQDVVRAARRAQAGELPAARTSWRERMAERFGGFAWIGTPRFAVAAAALGLILGVGGSMLLTRQPATPVVTAERSMISSPDAGTGEPVGPPDGSPTSIGAPVAETAAPPSGPFEDLVQQMLLRAEATQEAAVDSLPQQELDWGTSPGAGSMGRQVNTGETSVPAGSGRVTKVF